MPDQVIYRHIIIPIQRSLGEPTQEQFQTILKQLTSHSLLKQWIISILIVIMEIVLGIMLLYLLVVQIILIFALAIIFAKIILMDLNFIEHFLIQKAKNFFRFSKKSYLMKIVVFKWNYKTIPFLLFQQLPRVIKDLTRGIMIMSFRELRMIVEFSKILSQILHFLFHLKHNLEIILMIRDSFKGVDLNFF